jgi:short-subunit dehydrogenase
MQILADELENSKINVTGLNPGKVRTNFRTRAFPAENPETHATPDDVAKAAAFLLGENSNIINDTASHGKTYKLDDILSIAE